MKEPCVTYSASYWVRCPVCSSKTQVKVLGNTVLINFPLFCPKCKKEANVNIIQLAITLSAEPASPNFGDAGSVLFCLNSTF